MSATTNRITRLFDARDAWETHFEHCRTCGTRRGLCAAGSNLHTIYAWLKTLVEQGR